MIYADNGHGAAVVTSRKRARRFGLTELQPYDESRELARKINQANGCVVIKQSGLIPRRLLRDYWREIKLINQMEGGAE